MTNTKSKFTALAATGLFLVAFGAVIALIHWDLRRLIYAGNAKGFDNEPFVQCLYLATKKISPSPSRYTALEYSASRERAKRRSNGFFCTI